MEQHPDPDRWWNRKWKAVVRCTLFAGGLVVVATITALVGNETMADNTYRVMTFAAPTFLVPLLAYFGVSEWNNQTQMKQKNG